MVKKSRTLGANIDELTDKQWQSLKTDFKIKKDSTALKHLIKLGRKAYDAGIKIEESPGKDPIEVLAKEKKQTLRTIDDLKARLIQHG